MIFHWLTESIADALRTDFRSEEKFLNIVLIFKSNEPRSKMKRDYILKNDAYWAQFLFRELIVESGLCNM